MPQPRTSSLRLLQTSLGISSLLLIGCESTVSNAPPIREYSGDFQEEVAAELVACEDCNAITEMLIDYDLLRRQIRAARGGN